MPMIITINLLNVIFVQEDFWHTHKKELNGNDVSSGQICVCNVCMIVLPYKTDIIFIIMMYIRCSVRAYGSSTADESDGIIYQCAQCGSRETYACTRHTCADWMDREARVVSRISVGDGSGGVIMADIYNDLTANSIYVVPRVWEPMLFLIYEIGPTSRLYCTNLYIVVAYEEYSTRYICSAMVCW